MENSSRDSDVLPTLFPFSNPSEFLDQLSESVYVVERTDGTVRHANESARRRASAEGESVTGRSFLDVEPRSSLRNWNEFLQRLNDGESEGPRRVGSLSVHPFRDEDREQLLILVRASESPDSTKEERTALERYRETFNSEFEFRGVLDSEGRILEFNLNTREFLDVEPGELDGTEFWTLDAWREGNTSPGDIRELVETVREGEAIREVVTAVDSVGQERFIDLALSPYRDEAGTVERILGEGRDVSDLVRTERELREQKWRLESIAENIDDSIWMFTADWEELLFVNDRQYESIWGGSAEELREDPTSFLHCTHPDDREEILRAMELVSEGNDEQIEVRVNPSEDYETWVSINGYYQETQDPDAKDRVLGTVRDVTEIVEAYQELVEREQRFREMAETINEVFWVTDPRKKEMLYVSPAFEDIWGYDTDRLEENPRLWVEAIHPEDRPRITDRMADAQRAGEYDEEYRIRTADDELRWIHDKAFPIRNEHGDVVRILGVAEDITERVERERETRKKEKLASIGEMAAGVMHEINNPNAFIQGNVEFLHKAWEKIEPHFSELSLDKTTMRRLREEIPDVLESMRGGTRRIDKIVDNVKRFARESQEKPGSKTRLTDACERLRELVEDLKSHRDRTVELKELVCEVPETPVVPLTEEDFETVVMNLIDNALDALEDTGDPELTVGLGLRNDELRFWVQDNGQGIAEEDLSRITDPFFSTKSKARGTGLGLSIVATIVDRAGGDLSLDSEEGLGTLVEVRVPTLA